MIGSGVLDQTREGGVPIASRGREVKHSAGAVRAAEVRVPAHGPPAAPNQAADQWHTLALNEANDVIEVGGVVLDAKPEVSGRNGLFAGDRRGARLLAGRFQGGLAGARFPDAGADVRRQRAHRNLPAPDPPAAQRGACGAGDPACGPEDDHPSARPRAVHVAAERAPHANHGRVGAVRPADVLGAGEQLAEQQRAGGSGTLARRDREVGDADSPNGTVVEKHPPHLSAHEARDLAILDGHQRRQLFVGPRVVQERAREKPVVAPPTADVRPQQLGDAVQV